MALKGQETYTSFRCDLIWGLMLLSVLLTSTLILSSGATLKQNGSQLLPGPSPVGELPSTDK